MSVRARRLRRRGQSGFTLIEAVVTIGIVAASLVTLIGALAAAEKNAGMETQQAHVQVALGTLGDDLRSDGVSYNECTTNGGVYRTALNGAAAGLGVTVTSVAVDRPSNTGLAARSCSGGRHDYGLQRLTLTIREGTSSGSTVVFKSESTTATAATPTPTPGGGGGGGGG